MGREVRVELPYTLGHENAGWIHEVGSGHERRGRRQRDRAPLHHLCSAALPSRRRHALHQRRFPGISEDGGFADFLLTSARSVIKLDPSLEPKEIAA